MKTVGQSLAKYGATCQVGDLVHFSGEIAVDSGSSAVVDRFDQVPLDGRALLGETGELPMEIFQAPGACAKLVRPGSLPPTTPPPERPMIHVG
jgi:hypothetical protein